MTLLIMPPDLEVGKKPPLIIFQNMLRMKEINQRNLQRSLLGNDENRINDMKK